MFRSRWWTLALSASLGVICGCRSCFEITPTGRGRSVPCTPDCETCGSPGCMSPGYASGCCDGAAGLMEDGPALAPPSDMGGMMAPIPDGQLPAIGPQPRLVPQPQAPVQPYQPTGTPRLLSGLGR